MALSPVQKIVRDNQLLREGKLESKKPHGPTFQVRMRCIFCGYLVNNPARFTWNHTHQTKRITFAGRANIQYEEVDNPDYDEIMVEQLKRAAATFGFKLVKT